MPCGSRPEVSSLLFLLSHIIFQALLRAHCARPGRGCLCVPVAVSYGISRYRSFLFQPDEPVFCALLFITFFLLFFTGGNALCPLPDRFRGQKGGGCGGNCGGTSFHPHGGIPGQKSRSCAFPRGSLWSCMCCGHDGYYGAYGFVCHAAPAFPDIHHGAPGTQGRMSSCQTARGCSPVPSHGRPSVRQPVREC